eukprot:scaffold230729_cov26-Tisochrysis_lutea.AAC.4
MKGAHESARSRQRHARSRRQRATPRCARRAATQTAKMRRERREVEARCPERRASSNAEGRGVGWGTIAHGTIAIATIGTTDRTTVRPDSSQKKEAITVSAFYAGQVEGVGRPVDDLGVIGEPRGDPADGRRVEEGHGRASNRVEQRLEDALGRAPAAAHKPAGAQQREEGVA